MLGRACPSLVTRYGSTRKLVDRFTTKVWSCEGKCPECDAHGYLHRSVIDQNAPHRPGFGRPTMDVDLYTQGAQAIYRSRSCCATIIGMYIYVANHWMQLKRSFGPTNDCCRDPNLIDSPLYPLLPPMEDFGTGANTTAEFYSLLTSCGYTQVWEPFPGRYRVPRPVPGPDGRVRIPDPIYRPWGPNNPILVPTPYTTQPILEIGRRPVPVPEPWRPPTVDVDPELISLAILGAILGLLGMRSGGLGSMQTTPGTGLFTTGQCCNGREGA